MDSFTGSGFEDVAGAALSGTWITVALVVYLLVAVAAWKMFSKAGYFGLLALIPIVNLIVLLKIAGYSAWLVLLYVIPIVNIVFAIFVAVRVGANFGKGGFFSVLWLWLFPVVGYLVIGFGDARYRRV